MPNILELPPEILELVFSHLISTPQQRRDPLHLAFSEKTTAAPWRLVCRSWADWLYEHHLYRTLTFHSASRSLAFIDHLARRSQILPRAKCEYLEVKNLWNVEDPPKSRPEDAIDSEILASLLELFSDTIITLDLKFVEFFTLPRQAIKAIGCIKKLHNLHLHPQEFLGHPELTAADPACLYSLILEAQGLKSLKLELPVSFPGKRDLMAKIQYPAITHLEVEINYFDPDVILDITIALRPSLKLLSLQDFVQRRDCEPLLPVYETLKETIEGLSISNSCSLTTIRHLNFPKLRVLAIHGWLDSFADLLSQGLFSQSPIEIIAISSSLAKGSTCDFTIDTFSHLPRLRKSVFMNTEPDYSPPNEYLIACEAHHIKCVYVDHDDLCQIMKL